MQGRRIVAGLLGVVWWITPTLAEGFRCASNQGTPSEATLAAGEAAKPVAVVPTSTIGSRRALVLFARFKGDPANPVPAWAADIFNPDQPGSFSHFYDTMSFGKLRVRGQVGPRVYESSQPAPAYLANDQTPEEDFGRFSLEILHQADQDLDFAQFDNDGPDGIPNSGDDDGVVDAVFLVLSQVPSGFLLGEATGIAHLGFTEGYFSGDTGTKGKTIQVLPGQGTIQQGRSFAEAVGSICHEYGHVLGLPDLYNTAFLGQEDTGPEEDSAGVGAWDLMGWGALGWHGDDGPNSLSAWSRERLGWSEVEQMAQASQEVRLTPVGAGGRIVRVPASASEHYLLEYRTRTGTYYDRHLPGEGLLIWHAAWRPGQGAQSPAWVVDLECADGKWQDAGYPLGRQADAQDGADNLGFWARDESYAQAHAGNLGDATDPFDGVRYTAFTPDTNPASRIVRLTDIHFEAGQAVVQVQAAPPLLQVRGLQFVDVGRDGVAVVDEPVQVVFQLANQGGLPARQIKAVVRSEDPLVYVGQGEVHFGDLEVGQSTYALPQEGRYPTVVLLPGFAGAHTAELWLDLYLGESLVESLRMPLTGVAVQQAIQEVAVVDSLGNGDDLLQVGEFFTLALRLAGVPAKLLGVLHISLRALDPQVEAFGGWGSGVFFAADGDLARSTKSPEFLLRAGTAAGTRLGFELSVNSRYDEWKDTLYVQVAPGPDQTPPRVTWVRAQTTSRGVSIYVADRWIQDGSDLRAVQARVYDPQDTTAVAQIPLARTTEGFEGLWPAPGAYLVSAQAEDVAGNVGRSRLLEVTGLPAAGSGPETPAAAGLAQVELPEDLRPAQISTITAAPGDPRVWYAATPTSLWRTEDQGASWIRTGMMLNNSNWSMSVDPADPYRLLAAAEGNRILRSDDGGNQWRPVPLPQTLGALRWLKVDATRWGRVYGWAGSRYLLLTDDEGVSWREADYPAMVTTLLTHPADPDYMVAPWPGESDILWYSLDAGEHWVTRNLPRKLSSVRPDPGSPTALYGLSDGGLWHTDDRGSTWQPIDTGAAQGILEVQPHPSRPGLVYILDFQGACLRTLDGGKTWSRLATPGSVVQVVFSPADPEQVFLWCVAGSEGVFWYQSGDFGDHLARLSVPEERTRLAGTAVFGSGGQLYVGSMGSNDAGRRIPGLLSSLDQGSTWQWRPAARGYPFNSCFLDAVYVDPNRPEVILAHPSDKAGMLLRSEDGGGTWKGVLSPWQGPAVVFPVARPYPAILADPHQPGVCYAQGGGQVWRSTDYGATWDMRDLSGGDEEGRATLGSLALDPTNPSYLYTFISAVVWNSQDAGQTWVPVGAVAPGESIIALAFHPSGTELYAATTKNLYLSWDKGASWTPVLASEFGEWNSARFCFDPSDANHVYFVTNRYLYHSRDAGTSWQQLDPGIGGYPWYFDVAVDPTAPWMFYVATTLGLYRMDTRQTDTAVQAGPMAAPGALSLAQNYPNPFNPSTTINFSLPQAGEVELSIYNLLGQRVATLVQGVQEAGAHNLVWDGRDGQGKELGSGVYLYRLEAGLFRQTRRLVLVK